MTSVTKWPEGTYGYAETGWPVYRGHGGIIFSGEPGELCIAGIETAMLFDLPGTIDPEAKKHFTEYFK